MTTMRIMPVQLDDIPAWLALARQVEWLFGPMIDNPRFIAGLTATIERHEAICVRQGDGPPGAPFAGVLAYSSKYAPHSKITWLAVDHHYQRQGIGRMLVQHILTIVPRPAEVSVVTFGPDSAGGQPARRLYEQLGFTAAEAAPDGPEGGSRQVYRRHVY